MANIFQKPTVIARTALGLLEREIVLPALVWRDAVADYAGAFNDTVTLRVPARAKARRRALRASAQITVDPLNETKVDVSLDTEVYHAAEVTDAEATLDIEDFGSQVLMPQVRSIAEDLEDQLAAEMVAATYVTTLTLDTTKPENTLVDARKALNSQNVSRADRFAVLGADVEAAFLKSENLARVDASGTGSALREAELGRLRGFTIYGSNAIPADVGYCFHRSAYVLGVRAPIVPQGVAFGRSESYAGMAMRWIKDYDSAFLRDRSVVSTFSGTSAVIDGPPATSGGPATFVRSVKIQLTAP